MTFRRPGSGFTLIETLVAISLFAVMTVGIVPLLASSLRGSNLSRSYTVGKNLAVESMEKIRGLPYNISIGAQPTNAGSKTKVDVLDLYFPCATSSGCGGTATSYSAGVFTTTCTTGGATPACPRSIPSGYTVTYSASFVQPSGSTPESYTILTGTTSPSVPATYDWQTTNNDRAPSKLLQIKVSVSWKVGDSTESYDLETLKADRKFGSDKITGTGQVDYAVRAVSTFQDSGGRISDLVATGASSNSNISLRLAALGGEVARAGEMSLTQAGTLADPAVALATPPPTGAASSLQAPPDQAPPPVSALSSTVTHPHFCQDFTVSAVLVPTCQRSQVGYLSSTENSGLGVSASNERPSSSGTATLNTSATSTFDMFVGTQRNALGKNPLRLINETSYPSGGLISSPVLSFRANSGVATNDACSPTAVTIACRSMFAVTSGATGALGAADRRVEMNARTGFAEARIFPVDFISGASSGSKAVIRISNFTASTRCSATGSASSTATAAWSAQFDYYSEINPNDGITDGRYLTTKIGINSANFSTVLADLKALNPMVYEVPDDPAAVPPVTGAQQGDIYLFPKTDVSGVHPSYLIDLAGSAPTASVGSGGRTASALITGALTLTAAPTDPDVPQSSLSLVMGALSCSAADRR